MAVPNLSEIEKIKDEFSATQSQNAAATEVIKPEEKVAAATEGEAKETPTGEVVVESPTDKLSDDEIFALAEKRGMKVSRETMSPEQQKKAADIEETQKLQFAVEQGLITPEGYQEAKSIIASEGSDLTRKEFSKVYKEENKGATKEDIDSAYDDYYFVQKNVKVKDKRLKQNETSMENELEEFEEEKPKWNENLTKLGEIKRNQEAQNIKNGAKSLLENIDKSYQNYKTVVNRVTDYSKNIEKVISETDFSAYPTTHKIGDKEISAKVKFEKPDEIKADLLDYLNVRLAKLMVDSGKHNDLAEIKKQANAYLKDKYSQNFEENLWNLGKTEGINTAKVGSSSPLEKEVVSVSEVSEDAISQQVKDRTPKLPPKTDKSKR